MDSAQGGSFIPKSPVRSAAPKRRRRKIYVFTYVIFVFFLGTLIAAGVVWFLDYNVGKKLDDQQAALATAKKDFNQADMARVSELDARLTTAEALLGNQVSLLTFLQALEQSVLNSITISGFDYQQANGNLITVAMKADAGSFDAALFQREVLAQNPLLAGATVSDVVYSTPNSDSDTPSQGQVTFTITAHLQPSDIPYDPAPAMTTETSAENTSVSSSSSTAAATATSSLNQGTN